MLKHHLKELKIRLFYIILSNIVLFLVFYSYSDSLLYLFAQLLPNSNTKDFIFTYLPEAIFTLINISIIGSLYFLLPSIALNIILFLVPGLYKKEQGSLLFYSTIFLLLFYAGGLNAYFILIPTVFNIFLSFEITDLTLNVSLEPKINEYIYLTIKLILLSSVIHQFPLYLLLLVKTKILTIKFLIQSRLFIISGIIILGSIVAPADFITQLLLTFLLLIITEFSIFIILLNSEYSHYKNL